MTDRLPAIKMRKIRDGWITQNQADWLIQEVERLRKKLDRPDDLHARDLKTSLTQHKPECG